MSDSVSCALLEAAYIRLVANLEARKLTPDLKSSALEALTRAKAMIEQDPVWVAGEFDRIAAITDDHSDDTVDAAAAHDPDPLSLK